MLLGVNQAWLNTRFRSILTTALVNTGNSLLAFWCWDKSGVNMKTSFSSVLTTALVNAENSLLLGVSWAWMWTPVSAVFWLQLLWMLCCWECECWTWILQRWQQLFQLLETFSNQFVAVGVWLWREERLLVGVSLLHCVLNLKCMQSKPSKTSCLCWAWR